MADYSKTLSSNTGIKASIIGILNGNLTQGDIIFPAFEVTGYDLNKSAGAITLPLPRVAIYTGSHGDIQIPNRIVTGTTHQDIVSQVDITVPLFVVTGYTGAQGKINIPLFAVAGVITIISSNGDITFPIFTVAANGLSGGIGEGTVVLPLMTVSGTAYLRGVNAGAITIPNFKVEAKTTIVWGTVLVLNPMNSALSTYTNYPFNSFAYFNGKYLGCSSDGIHEIGAATDNSTIITLTIQTPTLDLETVSMKKIRYVWLGYLSNGALTLSVIIEDGTVYPYDVLSYNVNDHGQRVLFGKGLRDRYVSLKLQNVAGATLELDKIRIFVENFTRVVR